MNFIFLEVFANLLITFSVSISVTLCTLMRVSPINICREEDCPVDTPSRRAEKRTMSKRLQARVPKKGRLGRDSRPACHEKVVQYEIPGRRAVKRTFNTKFQADVLRRR